MFDIKTQHIAFGLCETDTFGFILFYVVCHFYCFFSRVLKLFFGYNMSFLSCIVEDGGLEISPPHVRLCWILYVHNKVD